MKPKVIVVGGINHDMSFRVAHAPARGETVLATTLLRSSGGKGANQAVAAARSGARTALIGAVGDDAVGAQELQVLADVGVDVSHVARVAGVPTGLAAITLSAAGDNSIIVVSGANACLSAQSVCIALEATTSPGCLVVLQTEVPAAALEAAAVWCAARGIRIVVNNGPSVALSPALLAAADPLVVNEPEAAQMLTGGVAGDARQLAHALRAATSSQSVVVTLGGRGAVWASASGGGFVAAQAVEVVDTTGAGDAFVGALAAGLTIGSNLAQAVESASAVAAQVVQQHGARLS